MSAAFASSIEGVITGVTDLAVFLSGALPYLAILAIVAVPVYKFHNKLTFLRRKKSDSDN